MEIQYFHYTIVTQEFSVNHLKVQSAFEVLHIN